MKLNSNKYKQINFLNKIKIYRINWIKLSMKIKIKYSNLS